MRIVSWNIRAGGGRRGPDIAAQLQRWSADVVALQEFRATPPSVELARRLALSGLQHQRVTVDAQAPARNGLLVASRWPLRQLSLARAPGEPCRWLMVRIAAPRPFALGVLHAPNYVTGRKYPFLDAVLDVARRWRGGPALIAGDSNSTQRDLDEEVPFLSIPEEHFIRDMHGAGWRDGYRHLRGRRRTYSWYSPNGRNGYRLDQAFINPALIGGLERLHYRWGKLGARAGRREALSDHAAMLVDVQVPGADLPANVASGGS